MSKKYSYQTSCIDDNKFDIYEVGGSVIAVCIEWKYVCKLVDCLNISLVDSLKNLQRIEVSCCHDGSMDSSPDKEGDYVSYHEIEELIKKLL